MRVASLEIELLANMARLRQDMDRAQRTVGGAMQRIDRAVSGTMKALGGLAAGLSVAALAGWVKTAVDAADAAGDAAAAVGLSVESYTALAYAAKMGGLEATAFNDSLSMLNRKIAEGDKVLGTFGITAQGGEEALMQIAEQFAKMPDGVTKSALAIEIFGKSGAKMVPLLNEGRDGIAALMREAQALGIVIDTETANAAGQFNDDLDRLKMSFDSLAIEVAKRTLPALTSITTAMSDAAKESGLLKAVWVGMAGVLAESFKESDAEKIAVLERNIASLKKTIESPGSVTSFSDWLYGESADAGTQQNIKQLAEYEKQLAALRRTQAAEKDQRERDAAQRALDEAEKRRNEAEAASKLRQQRESEALSKQREREYAAAVKGAEKYIEALRRESAEIGMNADQLYMMNAAREAASAPLESQRMRIMQGALAALEAKKAWEAQELSQKRASEAAEEYANLMDRMHGDEANLMEQVAKQQEYNDSIGLSAEALGMLEIRRLEDAAASKEQTAALMDQIDWSGKIGDSYRSQAEEIRKLAGLKREAIDKGAIVEEQQKIADQAQKVWDNFTQNVQRNLGDGLYGVMTGNFKDIGDEFHKMLSRMVADSLAADLSKSMFPAMPGGLFGGSSGGGMGVIGSAISAVAGGWGGWGMSNAGVAASTGLSFADLAGSFDGGGFTGNGPRSGGIDGKGGFPAILHPQETVIDHSKGQSTDGGRGVTVHQTINFTSSGPIDRRTQEQVAAQAGAGIRRALSRIS